MVGRSCLLLYRLEFRSDRVALLQVGKCSFLLVRGLKYGISLCNNDIASQLKGFFTITDNHFSTVSSIIFHTESRHKAIQNHFVQILLVRRQRCQIRNLVGGCNSRVRLDFGIIENFLCITEGDTGDTHCLLNSVDNVRSLLLFSFRHVSRIGTRIRTISIFVKLLQYIQRLLGCKFERFTSSALQIRQSKQLRTREDFARTYDILNNRRQTVVSATHHISISLLIMLNFADQLQIALFVSAYIVLHRYEVANCALTLANCHNNRRGDTTNTKQSASLFGGKTRQIDTIHPVDICTSIALISQIIVNAIQLHCRQLSFNRLRRLVRHPQTIHRLCAVSIMKNVTHDNLAFTVRVARVNNLVNVLTRNSLLQKCQLRLGARITTGFINKLSRNNGQRIYAPSLPVFIIVFRVIQL